MAIPPFAEKREGWGTRKNRREADPTPSFATVTTGLGMTMKKNASAKANPPALAAQERGTRKTGEKQIPRRTLVASALGMTTGRGV
jgi:hypothetical protein